MALRVTMTTGKRPFWFQVQPPWPWRKDVARGWGQMRGTTMSPVARSLTGIANSGTPQTHPGPSPTPSGPCLPDPPPPAFPGSQGAREPGTGNHTPRPYLIPISLRKLM